MGEEKPNYSEQNMNMKSVDNGLSNDYFACPECSKITNETSTEKEIQVIMVRK